MRKCFVHCYLLRRIGGNLHVMKLRGAPSCSYLIKFNPKHTLLWRWKFLRRFISDQNAMRMIIIYTINRQLHMFNVAPLVKMIGIGN